MSRGLRLIDCLEGRVRPNDDAISLLVDVLILAAQGRLDALAILTVEDGEPYYRVDERSEKSRALKGQLIACAHDMLGDL